MSLSNCASASAPAPESPVESAIKDILSEIELTAMVSAAVDRRTALVQRQDPPSAGGADPSPKDLTGATPVLEALFDVRRRIAKLRHELESTSNRIVL